MQAASSAHLSPPSHRDFSRQGQYLRQRTGSIFQLVFLDVHQSTGIISQPYHIDFSQLVPPAMLRRVPKPPSEQGVFWQAKLHQPLGEGGFLTGFHHCTSPTSAFRLLAPCLAAVPTSSALPFPAPKVPHCYQAGTSPLTPILPSALLIRHSEVLDPPQHQERSHQQHVRGPAPAHTNEALALNRSPQPPGAEGRAHQT